MKQITLLFCLAIIGSKQLSAQDFLEISTQHNCSYSAPIEEELFSFEKLPPVPEMVQEILKNTDSQQNFILVQSNVASVAAVLSEGKRYLLYSQDYYLKLPREEKALAVGLLAHEIGHHLAEHTFDPEFRQKEELEADLFMGYALCKTPGIRRLESALDITGKETFNYPVSKENRQKAIESGWKRAEDFLRGQGNLADYENESTNADLSLPRFPWPPPQCSQRITLNENLSGRYVDIDTRLRKYLNSNGYSQQSYFQTPGGFALVTQLEQFNQDGSPRMGKERWTDYPVPDKIDGLWSYLKSLVMPSSGNFRIFVFVLTDIPYNQSSRRVSKEEAVAWLSQGFNRLPKDIGNKPLTDRHYLDVLVYEFEAKQPTKRCAQKCPCTMSCMEHLYRSGLGRLGF